MIPVTVAAGHCDIQDDLRVRAELILRRLGQLSPFAQEGAVVFDAAARA